VIFSECDSILLYAEEMRDKLALIVNYWHVDSLLGHVFEEIVCASPSSKLMSYRFFSMIDLGAIFESVH